MKTSLSPSSYVKRAFTLIELLVVIAIIAILAAILFPVFGQAREKARQSTCTSNLKQFMLGIMQYNQDFDEMMPISISGNAQVGPVVAKANGVAEFSVAQEIYPYVKSQQVFQCPDDAGFSSYTSANTAGGFVVPNGAKVWEAYGTSYKFTKENLSMLPSTTSPVPANPKAYTVTKATSLLYPAGTACLAAATCTGGQQSPFPMPIAFMTRPAEQRVMRCFVAPWEAPIPADSPAIFHKNSDIMAFMDGHVKTVISAAQYDSFCDGATLSPIRKTGVNPVGDGSCNSSGLERNK